jgi:hypothetical protein
MGKFFGRNLVETVKDEMVMRERILSELTERHQTVPELSLALEKPEREIMLWVMAMWRYGLLEEQGKPNGDGYYKYQPVK